MTYTWGLLKDSISSSQRQEISRVWEGFRVSEESGSGGEMIIQVLHIDKRQLFMQFHCIC